MTEPEIRRKLYDSIMTRIDFSRQVSDAEILDLIDDEIVRLSRQSGMLLTVMKQLRREL